MYVFVCEHDINLHACIILIHAEIMEILTYFPRWTFLQYYLYYMFHIFFPGESDDDHEELYLAADSARNASGMYLDLFSMD